jgi:hypothetical protein
LVTYALKTQWCTWRRREVYLKFSYKNLKEKDPLGDRCRWEDNIKIDFNTWETGHLHFLNAHSQVLVGIYFKISYTIF